ncbi:MAG: DUF4221 family protein [Mongoliitalea sp.]
MNKYLLLCILLCVCMWACSEKDSFSEKKAFTNSFTHQGQVKLAIDSVSNFDFTEFQVIQEEGIEMLLVLNKVNFSLDFYELETGEMVKRTVIVRDEKFPLRPLYGFYYHNADSVFLFNQMLLNGTSLVNGQGEVVTQYNPQIMDRSNPQEMMKSLVNHYSRANNMTIFEAGSLYFSDMTLNGFLNSDEDMKAFRPAVQVDLLNNEVVRIEKITVPEFYHGKMWPMGLGNYSRIRKGDLWIYSWSALDSLLIYDNEWELVKSVNAKSEFAKPLKYSAGSGAPKDVEIREKVSQTTYSSLIYDAYRDVYYRFVTIGREVEDSDFEEQFPQVKNEFSVIVLDKDFNLLTEKRFPGKIHKPYNSFVGKKGLYLSRTNSFYEGLNEDEVVLDIYRFD